MENHLNHGLATASLNGQGMADNINKNAIPKSNNVFRNLSREVAAFFTEILPA